MITAEPLGSDDLLTGLPFNTSVTAQSILPVSYRWYQNGNFLAGQTNSAFGIASLVLTNAGTYVVVVSNASGAVTQPGHLAGVVGCFHAGQQLSGGSSNQLLSDLILHLRQ